MSIHSIYDAPEFCDRYTIFTGRMSTMEQMECLCVNDKPTDPWCGFSQFSSGTPGDHCGKEISFDELPEDVQKHVDYRLNLTSQWDEEQALEDGASMGDSF